MTIAEHAALQILAYYEEYRYYFSMLDETDDRGPSCDSACDICPAGPSCLELSEGRQIEAFTRNWPPVYQHILEHYPEVLI